MEENNGLGLEYDVIFNVKDGAKKATKELEALSAEWQAILDKQQLSIKMGAEASNSGTSNAKAKEKRDSTIEYLKNNDKELTSDEINYQKRLSRDAKILMQKKEFEAAIIAEQQKRTEQELKNIDIESTADKIAYEKRLSRDAKILMQKKEFEASILAEQQKRAVNSSVSAAKNPLSMDETSIDNTEKKLQALNTTLFTLKNTAQTVGFDNTKLNGAITKTESEIERLQQKLVVLRAAFGNKSLDDLLTINPKSIREASALIQELSNRRQDLNRGDANYVENLSSINKKIAQLSATNAKEIQQGTEKIKVIDSQTAAYSNQSNTVSQLRNMAMQYLSVYEGARLIKNIADITGEFELQRTSLSAILQDADKATEIFGQIKSLAVLSPFTFKDLVSYTKQLAAYRIETDQLYDTTKRLADVSAGLGVDMSRLILAYGQVSAASVLRGQELRLTCPRTKKLAA